MGSSPQAKPAAITGYAAVNAMGRGTAEVLASLDAGRSGLAPPRFPLPIDTVVGAIPGELPPLPDAVAGYDTRIARIGFMALADVRDALDRALVRWGKRRVAILLGTSTGGLDATEVGYRAWAETGALPPTYRLETRHDFNAVGTAIGKVTGAAGPIYVISTACSSSGKVHASAMRLMRAGVIDAALVGGVDSLCRMTLHGFRGLGILDTQRCRPFDRARAGINIGEGGALMLLERDPSLSDVHVLGVGESSDAYNMSSPEPTGRGAREAMGRALALAGITPGDVDLLLAHGTATPQNDTAESAAIEMALGTSVPVVSTKAFTGHQLGGAGATSAVFAVHAVRTGRVPANLGLTELDPAVRVNVAKDAVTRRVDRVLANAFAFGGSNVCLAIGRARGDA
ncbi:MAG: beta-ketoacyl-ACP synthase [Sandaracinus sp.]